MVWEKNYLRTFSVNDNEFRWPCKPILLLRDLRVRDMIDETNLTQKWKSYNKSNSVRSLHAFFLRRVCVWVFLSSSKKNDIETKFQSFCFDEIEAALLTTYSCFAFQLILLRNEKRNFWFVEQEQKSKK